MELLWSLEFGICELKKMSNSKTACPAFIGGEWRTISDAATSPVFNPSRGETIAEVPMCGEDLVNEAVEAAATAFPAWRETPVIERARLFFRYRQLIEENFDRICQSVSREHGKTLAEARGSVFRGIENIEYACGAPTLLMGDTLKTSRAESIARASTNRSASASASRRSISRRWCRCGCFRSHSSAEIPSS